jgi:hypothetical protein
LETQVNAPALFTDVETNGMINIAGADSPIYQAVQPRLKQLFAEVIAHLEGTVGVTLGVSNNLTSYPNFWYRHGFSVGIYPSGGRNKLPGRYNGGEVEYNCHIVFRTLVTPRGIPQGPFLTVGLWADSQYKNYKSFREDVKKYRESLAAGKNPFTPDFDFYTRPMSADAGTSEWLRMDYPFPHGTQDRFATTHFFQRPLQPGMTQEQIVEWFKLFGGRVLNRMAK